MTEGVRRPCGDTDLQERASHASGPIFSEDGRLILSESWTAFDVPESAAAKATQLEDSELVEVWRIWDCYEEAWANLGLALYRYEVADLVIRESSAGSCAWIGAVDTQARVLASYDAQECERNCWQWLRDDSAPYPAS